MSMKAAGISAPALAVAIFAVAAAGKSASAIKATGNITAADATVAGMAAAMAATGIITATVTVTVRSLPRPSPTRAPRTP
jgi:hypothetical protein